jgi:hypothetical protein
MVSSSKAPDSSSHRPKVKKLFNSWIHGLQIYITCFEFSFLKGEQGKEGISALTWKLNQLKKQIQSSRLVSIKVVFFVSLGTTYIIHLWTNYDIKRTENKLAVFNSLYKLV